MGRPRRPAVAGACPLAWVLAAGVALASLAPAWGARAEEPPAELLLADQESGGPRFRAVRGDVRDGVEVRAVRAAAPDGSDRVLRLAWHFDAAENARSCGPGDAAFERGAEVGARLALDDLDARGFDHLVLWIRADPGSGDGLKMQLRRPDLRQPGRRETGSFVVRGIDTTWRRVEIPLGRMTGIREWTHLDGLHLIVQARRVGAAQGAFYLDGIALLRTGRPGPNAWERVLPPRKQAWEAGLGGEVAARPVLRERLAGWPVLAAIDPGALPADDAQLLWRIARDTWRGLDALRDRESGLVLDTLALQGPSLAPADTRIGDFTNPTNVGLYLMALAAAVDLGIAPRAEALARLDTLLATLERLETWRGFPFNYYDTTSLERSSHFVSFVDSSWLAAGLMVARSGFPERAPRLGALLERGDFAVFYDPVERLMSHGFWVHLDVPSEYHYGGLYSEARIGSLIAIGKGDVPAEHWRKLAGGFPRFAARSARPTRPRPGAPVWTRPLAPGVARWRGIDFVPSWGGSMFEALMPALVLDEAARAPRSLGRNARAHAAVQRRYALEERRLPVWGMSPAVSPVSGKYAEYGVPVLGARGYPPDAVAPYAAALALAVEPAEATADLRALALHPQMYGDFGFYDALDPATGEVAPSYLALDQAMLFLALANHLGDGCVRRRFAEDPIAQRALPLVSDAWLAD